MNMHFIIHFTNMHKTLTRVQALGLVLIMVPVHETVHKLHICHVPRLGIITHSRHESCTICRVLMRYFVLFRCKLPQWQAAQCARGRLVKKQ